MGGTVCATHGGRAPQVQKSARERLAELVEPALKGLQKALKSNDLPDHCTGESDCSRPLRLPSHAVC